MCCLHADAEFRLLLKRVTAPIVSQLVGRLVPVYPPVSLMTIAAHSMSVRTVDVLSTVLVGLIVIVMRVEYAVPLRMVKDSVKPADANTCG